MNTPTPLSEIVLSPSQIPVHSIIVVTSDSEFHYNNQNSGDEILPVEQQQNRDLYTDDQSLSEGTSAASGDLQGNSKTNTFGKIFPCIYKKKVSPALTTNNHDNQYSTDFSVFTDNTRNEVEDAETENDNANEITPKHLHHFLQLMYNLGLSTYDPGGKDPSANWTKLVKTTLQKLAFWLIAAAAFLHALRLLKVNWFFFVEQGGIINFVDIAFWIFPFLVEICIAYIFAFQHNQINKMLAELDKSAADMMHQLENSAEPNYSKKTAQRVRKMVVALATVTILICFSQASIGNNENEKGWSVKKQILARSSDLSFAIHIWESNMIFNKTITQNLKDEYGTNITFNTIVLATISFLLEFFSNVKLEITVDLILVTGYCLKYHIAKFARKIDQVDFKTYCADGDDCTKLESPTGLWAEYRQLKGANKAINEVFDGLLKFMHLDNTMQCAYFLMHFLDNKVTSTEFFFLSYSILKLFFAYYIAKKSHSYNPTFEKWIRDWAMHSNDLKFLARLPAVLDEVKSEPLGLGKGEFIIGEAFLLKLTGFVGSMFMLQVDNSK